MGKEHKDKFFFGKVVEVIKDQGDPTLELRVRIPSLHGTNEAGVKDADLPLAKPLMLPGTALDAALFESNIVGAVLYVILEGGQVDRPLYFGLRADQNDIGEAAQEIPYATETVPGLVRVKVVGTTGYIYTSEPD